jgi:hypothetical protein
MDCEILREGFHTTWGHVDFVSAGDFDGDDVITCADYGAWLDRYRAFHGEPGRPDPCGVERSADEDGDGAVDQCDNCSFVANPDQGDLDRDTAGNQCDLCPQTPRGMRVTFWGCPTAIADYDQDGDVDSDDYALFSPCGSGPGIDVAPACSDRDLDGDHDVDQTDLALFQRCLSGTGHLVDPTCAD